jgi:hypothetical protein
MRSTLNEILCRITRDFMGFYAISGNFRDFRGFQGILVDFDEGRPRMHDRMQLVFWL